MKPTTLLLSIVVVLSSPGLLLACGGCTDAVLLMTAPWAGFGILLVWLWIVTMLAARWRLRKRGADNTAFLVRGSTLVVFAVLGSLGYVCLAFLTMGSLLLPSIFLGFVWLVYLIVRLMVDVVRLIRMGKANVRTPLLIHGAFLIILVALIAYSQTKANTPEHYVGCLRYGHHDVLFSRIMPRIVADREKSIQPLIGAIKEALNNTDGYTRMNTVKHATFCLACIGGPEIETFLSQLLTQRATPSDYCDLNWYKGTCFAYARCAGPRAVDDLVTLFEKMPHTDERDDRVFLLVALTMTGSKRGVAFTLDHMDLLVQQMDGGGDGSEMRVAQAAAECLIFGTDPELLPKIPAYRDCVLMGATWLAEPRPNDYTSEFYWTESSENGLRSPKEIEAAWRKDYALIKKRWADQFK